MHAMLTGIDRTATKNTVRDMLLENATWLGVELSKAKADRLAQQYKRGRLDELDPELQRVLDYADPTGEIAVRNVMATA